MRICARVLTPLLHTAREWPLLDGTILCHMWSLELIAPKKTYTQIATLSFIGIVGLFLANIMAPNGLQQLAAAAHSQSAPLFATLDTFVLFGSEGVSLDNNVQVSSGNLGANDELDLQKEVTVTGDLFSDEVSLDKDTIINGNVSYNKLQQKKDGQILGTQTKPVQLPIANLPTLPDFTVGTEDIVASDTATILPPGNYHNITVTASSTLTLSGGTYNLSSLILQDSATLIYTATTTLNIQSALKGGSHVAILPGSGVHPDDLIINYSGIVAKIDENENDNKQNDHAQSAAAAESDQEKSGGQGDDAKQTVSFKDNAFLNFRLIAPIATVSIGDTSTLRGQILARKVKVGKGIVVSRDETTIFITKPQDIVTDPGGGVYPINELLLNLAAAATPADAVRIAASVGGRVIGGISDINLYQIAVPTTNIQSLESAMATINSSGDPAIEGVSRNFVVFPTFYSKDLPPIENTIDTVPLTSRFETFYEQHLRASYLILIMLSAFLAYRIRVPLRANLISIIRARSFKVIFIGISFAFLFLVLLLGSFYFLAKYYPNLFPGSRRYEPTILGGSIPSDPWTSLGVVYADTAVKYDLLSLQNQNSDLTRPYFIIRVQQAWDRMTTAAPIPTVTPIIIGIVDWGVDAKHQEFNAPTVSFGSVNRALLSDFIPANLNPLSPAFNPVGGHGTQVTGIIGANNVSRNSILPSNSPQMNGILSGALREDQYTLEFKPIGGPPNIATSTQLEAIGALRAAIARGSQVVNMSFGGEKCSALPSGRTDCYKTDAEFNTSLNAYRDLFNTAPNTLFVAAVGNDAIDSSAQLPSSLSSLDNVIAIGATDLIDRRASFSNFGSGVSIAAPGVGVYAPRPPRPLFLESENTYDSGFSGTSASAPLVTGVAGLLKSLRSDLKASELKGIITRSADPISTGESGKDMGRGCFRVPGQNGCRLNADRAIRDLMYDFAIDRFEIDGNILGSGNSDGVADFADDFNDNSLTAPPTSSFTFSQAVTESDGFLHMQAADGTHIVNRFSGRLLEDDVNFTPRLTDGAGNSTITVTFRADEVLPGQFYGFGVSNDTPSLTESTAETITFSRNADGSTGGVRVNNALGQGTAFDALANLAGIQRITLRLKINDANNTVMPSYSVDNGATFINGPQFDSFSGPTTIFTTAPKAHIFVQGGEGL